MSIPVKLGKGNKSSGKQYGKVLALAMARPHLSAPNSYWLSKLDSGVIPLTRINGDAAFERYLGIGVKYIESALSCSTVYHTYPGLLSGGRSSAAGLHKAAAQQDEKDS